MPFTDQKLRVVTKEDLTAPWSGHTDGSHFYCKLCGHSFEEGDRWRWVLATRAGYVNVMVCESCDGDDVLDRWVALNKEWDELAKGKFRFIATALDDWQRELRYRY